MAARMGPRLAYMLDLPDELASLPVPTLLLQLLIETPSNTGWNQKFFGNNALKHQNRACLHANTALCAKSGISQTNELNEIVRIVTTLWRFVMLTHTFGSTSINRMLS